MVKEKLRVVHYLNQFFGQVGGEQAADTGFIFREGPIGPGLALEEELRENAKVVATVICGDNFFASNPVDSAKIALGHIEHYKPHLFFAGPAFGAGRYGVACGAICKAVSESLKIPAITGMHAENPGVEMYRQHAFICRTADNARGMKEALRNMVQLALALTGEKLGGSLLLGVNLPPPSQFLYFSRLILVNEFCEKTAAERSIDKLLAKLRGEPFETEASLPKFEIVDPPKPVADVSACELALITDGELVPRGNPDGLQARGNCKWAAYEVASIFTGEPKPSNIDVVHGGYFTDMVLGDPNRLLPVDVMYDLVKERKIGRLHPSFFSTSGNSAVSRKCLEMGVEIASEIVKRGISAIILTST